MNKTNWKVILIIVMTTLVLVGCSGEVLDNEKVSGTADMINRAIVNDFSEGAINLNVVKWEYYSENFIIIIDDIGRTWLVNDENVTLFYVEPPSE